jgi:hypothetical protein
MAALAVECREGWQEGKEAGNPCRPLHQSRVEKVAAWTRVSCGGSHREVKKENQVWNQVY